MITLAFFVSLLYLYLCCFLTQKSTLSDAFFGVFLDSVRCYFWCFADSPVLLDGGHHREVVRFVKMLRYPPSFMSLPCIFCKRMHLQYIEPFLCQHLGALPQTPTSLAAPQGRRLKPNHLTLWRSVGSAPRRQRVKCTASPPLTPLHLRESSKTIEADGAGNLSRLAKQPLAAWPLQVGGDNALW